MTAKRKSAEERKNEILDNALEIIHEEGHSGLTVRNIADKTHISEAAIYSHFDDKEEIMRSLVKEVFSKDEICCCDRDFGSAEKMLESMISKLFRRLEEKPEMTSMVFNRELFSRYPEIEELFRRHREENKRRLESMVEEGKEQGIVNPGVSETVFSTIMSGTVMMAVREWRESGMDHSLEDRSGEIAEELSKILSPHE